MNVYVFWILFFGLWGIIPLMIIKGRTDEKTRQKQYQSEISEKGLV